MQNYGYPHPYNPGARPVTNSLPTNASLSMASQNVPNNMIPPNIGPIQSKYMLQHQNPNSTVDPIYYHQQYSSPPSSYYPKPYAPKLTKGLTFEEGKRLLQVWRHNNFADFNSWVQVAKAQVSIDISETSNDMVHKGEKLYNCNLILTFEEDKGYSLKAHGFGKSKKDAKRMAIEGIVADLIKSGEIKRGLKNKDFLLPGYNNMKPGSELEEGPYDQLQKKIHRMAKKMHDCLKQEDFIGAYELLYQIILKKKPDWNEISFIWCYALLKRNVAYLKSIIDLIQYRKLLDDDLDNPSQENVETQTEAEEIIRRELLERYGNTRLKNSNIYEQQDAFNVESNLVEINPAESKEITEEEAATEILMFPLARDLNYILQPEKEDLKTGSPHLGPPPNIKDPYKYPLNTFPPNHPMQLPPNNFRPPQSFNIHPPPPSNSMQPPSQPPTKPPYGISAQNPGVNLDSGGWTLSHQPSGWAKPEKLQEPIVHSSQGAFHPEPPKTAQNNVLQPPGKPQAPVGSIESPTDLSFTKELKNPEINYLSYKLLEELYESLLYVGDLNFSVNMTEVLYNSVKLDDDEFLSNNACQYYAHKKNMLMVELVENIFQPINRSKTRIMEYLVTLDGVIEKIGNKYAQEVLEFSSIEPIETVKTKISKSRLTEWNEAHAQIAEGEFVMLISLVQSPPEIDIIQEPQSTGFQEYMPPIMNQRFQNQPRPIQGRPRGSQQDTSATIEVAMIACVKEISKDYRIKLFVLPTKEQSEAISEYGRTWKITKLANQTATGKTSEALEVFTTRISMLKPLTQILLLPPNCSSTTIKQLAESNVQLPFKAHPPYETSLNVSQKKALQLATSQLLTLIQGPPGSGKTITTIEIVLEWFRQSSLQVLVCAESNSKVDELHSEFEKIGVRSVKLSSFSDNEEHLSSNRQPFSPPNMRNDNFIRTIRQAQVICATCISCSSDYLRDMTFARILIMDASSLVESDCLIPLTKGCQQLVLIGDHKGLSPKVNSMWAQSKGMAVSLFERLIKQGVQPQLLNIQYRIHQSLAAFPSQYFYGKALETGVGDNQRPMILGFNWPNQAVRVALVNIKGEEKIHNSSIQNAKEIEVVVEVLMHILKSGYNQPKNIGILTLYEAQKNRLKNEINIQAKKFPQIFGLMPEQAYVVNKNSNLIDIEVVASSANIEDKDLIIFSAVRSNMKDKLGLLKDSRRMNYVLTKAKRDLIVIGNIETLNHDKNWSEWIKWCRANKVVLHYTS